MLGHCTHAALDADSDGSVGTGAEGVLPRVLKVGIALFAGQQSDRRAVEEALDVYYPCDIDTGRRYNVQTQEWVSSHFFDVSVGTAQGLLGQLAEHMASQFPGQEYTVVWVSASPECQTFSVRDASNSNKEVLGPDGGYVRRNVCYRDWANNCDPLVREVSDDYYGKYTTAVAADNCVKNLLLILNDVRVEYPSVHWMVENPLGGLSRRPYMLQWMEEAGVKLQVVDYCAYEHYIQKPTHVWTTLSDWEPQGRSGNGRCGQCIASCLYGFVNPETGCWKHLYSIGNDPGRGFRGEHRMSYRHAVPHLLHCELLGHL